MPIKLELYRIFKEVCESGSISEAAKKLYISQSAVSQAMKQLEQQCGIVLLHRTAKGVMLTGEGQILFEYASSAIDLLNAAESKMVSIKNLTYGELKIGASDTISKYMLIPILEQFSRQFPDIKLRIVNRTSIEAVSLLKSGKLDLAFVNMPIKDDDITISSYLEVNDIFVGASDIYKADNEFSLSEIAQLPLILLEEKANSRRYVQNYFYSKGITLAPEIELGSHDLLLELARINLGVSCVIKEFSTQYLNSCELTEIKLTEPIPKRHIGVARLKGVSLSNASREFIKYIPE